MLTVQGSGLGLAQVCSSPTSATCPQLILLDMNMPVMNGLEFLEAYQGLPAAQRQTIVVVMLTTSLHKQDELLARQLPIADFLAKPLTRAKVTDLLSRHFPRPLASAGCRGAPLGGSIDSQLVAGARPLQHELPARFGSVSC